MNVILLGFKLISSHIYKCPDILTFGLIQNPALKFFHFSIPDYITLMSLDFLMLFFLENNLQSSAETLVETVANQKFIITGASMHFRSGGLGWGKAEI